MMACHAILNVISIRKIMRMLDSGIMVGSGIKSIYEKAL